MDSGATYRRVWAKRGQRPLAPSRTGYQWTYVYAVVHPATGQVFWWLLPSVNTELMTLFLHAYAASLPADVVVVLILDGAGWHTSARLAVPDNLVLAQLPARTPELNPAEHLWPLLREATSNRSFDDLDQLETTLVQRCLDLDAQPQRVASTTRFHGYAS